MANIGITRVHLAAARSSSIISVRSLTLAQNVRVVIVSQGSFTLSVLIPVTHGLARVDMRNALLKSAPCRLWCFMGRGPFLIGEGVAAKEFALLSEVFQWLACSTQTQTWRLRLGSKYLNCPCCPVQFPNVLIFSLVKYLILDVEISFRKQILCHGIS
jgi:hypothetical protein